MVREYKSPVIVYNYPFEYVMLAYHKRFPTNSLIPELLSSEITYNYESPDSSIIITERKCKIAIDAPYLLKKIAGVDCANFVQRNSLNKADRTLLIEVRNESFESRVSVFEKCTYFVSPENPEQTCFTQEACLDIKSFFGFESALEKLAVKIYSKSIEKTPRIIHHFINELKENGIHDAPMFSAPNIGFGAVEQPSRRISLNEITFRNPLVSGSVSTDMTTIFNDIDDSGLVFVDVKIHEEDCLKRFLSGFSLIESNGILLIRKKLSSGYTEIHSCSCILRFLRSVSGDVNKAYEALVKHIKWRQQNHIDDLIDWRLPSQVSSYYLGQWNHHDKNGSPLYIMQLGQMDVKGLMKTIGPDGFSKIIIQMCEQGIKLAEEATIRMNKPILSISCLCDLDGLSLKYAWKPILQTVLRLIELLDTNYPELLSQIIIIRAPKIYSIIWSFISTIISEKTIKKFVILSDQCLSANKLTNYIAEEFIPGFLNPNLPPLKTERQLVPKSLFVYKNELQSDFMGSISIEDLYKRVSVTKVHNVEVGININNEQSVITWDFDVLEGDTVFCVYKASKANVSSLVSILSTSSLESLPSVSPATYKEGHSVQGSYCCGCSGTYVLQWKLECRDNQKCKRAVIIYYYDILPSSELRRSFSSIASSLSNVDAIDTFSISTNSSSNTVSF